MKLRPLRIPPGTLLAFGAALFSAGAAAAATPTPILSWAPCDVPPVLSTTITPGQSTGANLYVFLTGMSVSTQSYEVWVMYGDANSTVPDAWRFDAAGCQGSTLLAIDCIAPPAITKTCPSFQDAGGSHASFQVRSVGFMPASLPFPQGLMVIQLADLYSLTPNTPVAETTYLLMELEFNQYFGVYGPSGPAQSTCGGLETPMCFAILRLGYVPADGSDDVLIDQGWNCIAPRFCTPPKYTVTANWGDPGSCAATPVHPATWGSIKAQYRN